MVRSIPQLEQPLGKWLISCGEYLQTLSMLTLPPAKFSSRKKRMAAVSCHDSSIFCVTYLKHFKDKQNLRILRVWNHLSCLTRAMTLTCLYFRRLNTELCQRLLFFIKSGLSKTFCLQAHRVPGMVWQLTSMSASHYKNSGRKASSSCLYYVRMKRRIMENII